MEQSTRIKPSTVTRTSVMIIRRSSVMITVCCHFLRQSEAFLYSQGMNMGNWIISPNSRWKNQQKCNSNCIYVSCHASPCYAITCSKLIDDKTDKIISNCYKPELSIEMVFTLLGNGSCFTRSDFPTENPAKSSGILSPSKIVGDIF